MFVCKSVIMLQVVNIYNYKQLMILGIIIDFFMSQFIPSDEQLAQILISQGVQPLPNQSPEQYHKKVEQFIKKNKHLRNTDYDHYIKNKDKIHQALKNRLKIKYALVSTGHIVKWAKTTHSAITIAASKIGAQGMKAGWGSLVISTSQVGVKQLTKATLMKTLTSSTTWIVAGVVCAIQIGVDFYKLCNGQITIKQFFINSGKHILNGAASVLGGAGGAALGASIGTFIGGPIGSIIGIIVGGIAGGISASLLTNAALDKIQQACFTFNNPKKILKLALDFFQLPENYTGAQLQAARKAKYTLYHPDIWKDAKKQVQEQKSKKLMETLQFYQIIVNYK